MLIYKIILYSKYKFNSLKHRITTIWAKKSFFHFYSINDTVHKRCPHKIAKNLPPLFRKMSSLVQFPSSLGHTTNSKNLKLFCSKNYECSLLKDPYSLLIRLQTSFMDSP